MSLLATVLPALIPAVSDGIRSVIQRFTGGAGAKPANIAEVIQLMAADTDRLRVLQQLDAAGDISKWVANLRALQRPAMASWILLAYIGAMATSAPAATVDTLAQLASMVVFYLFGDRTYHAIRGK